MRTLDRSRLPDLMAREERRFIADHPRSRALHERARLSLPGGVPMNWMAKWAGPFPVFVESAQGASFRDVDGNAYVDFCLGDTGAMAGHSPAPTVAAVEAQLARGITHMLPTEDAAAVGEELTRRFGLPLWQFTLTATDANRFSLRLARLVTGRPKVVVHDHCYHGTVDEAFAWLTPDGRRGGPARQPRPGRGSGADHEGRALQRRRGARARPRPARRGGGDDRARADQRGHRAARARLPRRRARADAPQRAPSCSSTRPTPSAPARAGTRRSTASSRTSS